MLNCNIIVTFLILSRHYIYESNLKNITSLPSNFWFGFIHN